MNYVEKRDCEPLTQDEVERRQRDRNRAMTLDFAAIPDPPFGYFSATGDACPADKPVSLPVGAFPPPIPMIDWERVAASHAHDCAVMAKALQKANKEIARLMALLPAEAEAPRSSGDAIAAALRLPTVPGAYGRTP